MAQSQPHDHFHHYRCNSSPAMKDYSPFKLESHWRKNAIYQYMHVLYTLGITHFLRMYVPCIDVYVSSQSICSKGDVSSHMKRNMHEEFQNNTQQGKKHIIQFQQGAYGGLTVMSRLDESTDHAGPISPCGPDELVTRIAHTHTLVHTYIKNYRFLCTYISCHS